MELTQIFRHLLGFLIVATLALDTLATVAQSTSKKSKEKKRHVRVHKHRNEILQVVPSKTPEVITEAPTTESITTSTTTLAPPPPPESFKSGKQAVVVRKKSGELLDGLYPDIRSCYDGIPRKFEKFANDRMEKREMLCSSVYSNTSSVCYKQCLLVNLGYVMTYTVTLMGTTQRQRRYKVHQKSECGHNSFGQDLLGIDTKIWDDRRAERQKKEKERYFQKVTELGIRGFDPDPFHMKFATVFGEDITDERLEAQMHICKLFDISVDDVSCEELNPQDQHKLEELVACVETALTC